MVNMSLTQRLISLLLIAAMMFFCIPSGALAADEVSLSEETLENLPEESCSGETEPEETEPEGTEPEGTEQEGTEPEGTEPEGTEPKGTEPEETEPEETEPEETEPEETEPEETEPEETEPEETKTEGPNSLKPVAEADMDTLSGLFFGRLHAHTALSEGADTIEDVFQQAACTENLDFFAATDFSDSFDGRESGTIGEDGSLISGNWAAGKAAAASVTTDSFLGIFGYEMGWPSQMKIGHISTFGTPGFQSWDQVPYNRYDGALESYFEALDTVPGSVSQFNHPGTQYGTFCEFDCYSDAADQAVGLLEISFEDKNPLRYYTKALDRGWHLAPTGAERTAVFAEALTEAAILRALGSCRAYTTEDTDLQIFYTMDGNEMGSRLDLRDVGETMDISLTLADPTDGAAGQVEVITNGGKILLQPTVSADTGNLSVSLPTQSGYYFLRITQPDGDTALTAPIWVDAQEELGISNLVCETAVPVQNKPVVLMLEVQNGEAADFLADSLEIRADGIPVTTDNTLTSIPGGSLYTRQLTFACDCTGLTNITVVLEGTLEGSPRIFEKNLSLSFRRSDQVTAIVVDGSHGNADIEDLKILKTLAMQENIRLVVAEEMMPDMLKDCRFLLVSAPAVPFSEQFLKTVSEFAGYGGSLVVCGRSRDAGFYSAAELNRLFAAIGSTMKINDDLVLDTVHNGADTMQLYTGEINRSLSWCENISENQVYRHVSGCSVDAGSGTWLVKGHSTTAADGGEGEKVHGTGQSSVTLLACEELSGGGTAFAAGSLFVSDSNMEEPHNIWDEPYANRTIGQQLLGIGGESIPLSTIQEAREGEIHGLFRIRGYVTAGTSNPHNTFPETLYLQDDTGGIAVAPFTGAAVQQGTAVEVTGFAGVRDGNRILKVSAWKVLDTAMYQYQGLQGSWDTLLDPGSNGGRLVQVEGKCLEIYCREDDTLAGCLLADEKGNQATVKIEDYIFAGSDGENDLHKTIRKGRTVRAIGLLHVDAYGDTVIRARNCEEVAWVPPRNYWNPRTGDDRIFLAASAMTGAIAGLLTLKKRRKE